MHRKKKSSWIKIVLKGFLGFFEFFTAFIVFYLTVSIYGAVIPVGGLRDHGDVCIYVRSNGVHTDICLPTVSEQINWLEFISPKHYAQDTPTDYVAIGWGDKGFFMDTPTWAELKFSTAFNAAFLPSATAMHVWYSEEPQEDMQHKKVWLSKEQYSLLINYIRQSFALKNGKVDLIPDQGYTEFDNFYEANNSYHLFRTCNVWTNEALKSAGVKTGLLALFPDGVLKHL